MLFAEKAMLIAQKALNIQFIIGVGKGGEFFFEINKRDNTRVNGFENVKNCNKYLNSHQSCILQNDDCLIEVHPTRVIEK